jgi:small subunit ribosomal protein S1
MVDMMMGEDESNNDEASGSPMWKYLSEEYDYKRPKRGDIRYAEVLRIDEDEIIVDIGGKTEGVVPSVDLDRMGDEALAEIEVGDKVPVYVLRPESADGDVIVSLNMARTMEDWRKAEKLFEEGGVHEGTVSGYNKGGLLVFFGQIRGFVPASQLSGLSRRSSHEDRMATLSKMEGQQLLLKVIEVDRQRRRLIFSERAASREWREMRKDELLNDLQEGDIRAGTVRNLCEFGAFVDLGGADGLIHISELSWRRVKHAREVLRVGEEVEVYVLRVDRERKRIGLSLKRLQPDPWHVAEERYEVGQIVRGVVTNIVDFGAFARIEDGIEGLIHVSELSDGDFAPRDLVKEGEQLYVKILSIDAHRQRMGLSLKQAPSREEVEGDEAWAALAEEGEAEEAALEVSLAEAEEAAYEAEEALEVELEIEEALPPTEVEEPVEEFDLAATAAEVEELVAEIESEEAEVPVAEIEAEAELVVELAEADVAISAVGAALEEKEPEAEEEVEAEEPEPSAAEMEAEAEEEPAAEVEEEEPRAEVEPEQPAASALEIEAEEEEPELDAEVELEAEPEHELEAVAVGETDEEESPGLSSEDESVEDADPESESDSLDVFDQEDTVAEPDEATEDEDA